VQTILSIPKNERYERGKEEMKDLLKFFLAFILMSSVYQYEEVKRFVVG